MQQDQIGRRDLERAVLRIRLAGIALGVTLLVLSPRSDQTAAGAVLLGYTSAVLITRFAPDRAASVRAPFLPMLAVGLDVLYAAALSVLLPPTVGTWALYAVAIGTAALGSGAIGAAGATAASIVAYDAVIALRADDLRPSDLWPVQLLLAIGLLVAELVWAGSRGELTHRRLRAFALVQRDLIAARDEAELLDRLSDHVVRTFGAASAWIELGVGQRRSIGHARGTTLPGERERASEAWAWLLDDAPMTRLRCTFEDAAMAVTALPSIRDVVTDASPLLVAARDRSRLARAKATLDRTLAGIRAIERDQVVNAVQAEVLSVAASIAGPAALVRSADGTVLAGDLSAKVAVALVRDTTPPALVRDRMDAPPGVVVSAGPGLALVAIETTEKLTDEDLRALTVLGEIAAAASLRIAERDGFIERGEAFERRLSEVDEQLQARDEAVASAVHELRTPLTSVQAYAQLTSRNLQAVQQQVKQLDRLIGDLLRPSSAARAVLQLDEVDLLHEAKQAGRRVTLVSGRRVTVDTTGAGPFAIRADRGRIEQVIENVLNNAVKFSPPGEEVEVELSRREHSIVLAVTDRGSGIPADELPRIFERHYRGASHRDSVAGEGIGLAVAHEIVVAHGGRIWAASDGPGRGTTFFIALPIEQPEPRPQPLESTGGRRSGDQAPHQA